MAVELCPPGLFSVSMHCTPNEGALTYVRLSVCLSACLPVAVEVETGATSP